MLEYALLFLTEHMIKNAKLNKNAQICPLADPSSNIQICKTKDLHVF
jgi:hypothetical protein